MLNTIICSTYLDAVPGIEKKGEWMSGAGVLLQNFRPCPLPACFEMSRTCCYFGRGYSGGTTHPHSSAIFYL